MLIACPACASEYEIEGVLVGKEGRSVRCAACSETWFVGPEASAPEETGEIDAWDAVSFDDAPKTPAPVVIDQPMPPPRAAKPKAKRAKRKAKPKRFAIPRPSPALAAGLALFAILPLAAFGRTSLVRVMPQSAGLFSAIGLPVNLRGVDFREVTAFRNPAEGANPAQLIVEGDLVGVARDRVAVSPLEIELRDAHDQSLYRWTVPPSRPTLESGETARFRASLSAPPAQGSQVVVRFADAGAAETAKAPAVTEDAQHGHH